MGGRKCCIEYCPSSSIRVQDRGVTFHRFPINPDIRKVWLVKCRMNAGSRITKATFVCSRHFRKADFQAFKGTKYLLKQGSIPSIFSFDNPSKSSNDSLKSNESLDESLDTNDELNSSGGCSSPVTGDSKQIRKKSDGKLVNKRSASAEDAQSDTPQKKIIRKSVDSALNKDKNITDFTTPEKIETMSPPKIMSPPILNFVPGTKIEAQDFNKAWHTAKVVEVDSDDREVLIHFEKNKNKALGIFDEWISMDSSRLRPIQISTKKSNIFFDVGEKCLARWSDARKFPGTIQRALDNDSYEILFDDGYVKTVKVAHITKLKKSDVIDVTSPIKQESEVETIQQIIASTSLQPKIYEYVSPIIDWDCIPDQPEGEWSCHWYNDAPVGQSSSFMYSEGRLMKSTVVKDNRLPEGWIKHVFQRTGLLGKWDIILVSPTGRVFRSKFEMKQQFEDTGQVFNTEVFDFCLHKRRAKELGLSKFSADYFAQSRVRIEKSSGKLQQLQNTSTLSDSTVDSSMDTSTELLNKDFVMVGSVKVQIINNLFRCPEENCLKNFRKENHLQIHIKHYHKELAKLLGCCPNMTDLAYLRTLGTPSSDDPLPKNHLPNNQFFEKVHQHDLQNKHHRKSSGSHCETPKSEQMSSNEMSPVPMLIKTEIKQEKFDTAKHKYTLLEEALNNSKPIETIIPKETLPKTILQEVVNPAQNIITDIKVENPKQEPKLEKIEKPAFKIVSHPATRPPTVFHRSHFGQYRRKIKARTNTNIAKPKKLAEKIQKASMNESFTEFDDTRQSFGSPESVVNKRQKFANQILTSESMQDTNSQNTSSLAEQSQSPKYIQEDGEVIKIVRMRQEEIINCICRFPEEDGLMIQCELCLCWQHGICNNIERENEVPEKYICLICRNPQRARNSLKYKHDQEWLYEGRLPTFSNIETFKREKRYNLLKSSHTLTGNLLELKTFLNSLKIKINIAEKKEHPKMYLWSKKWETSPIRTEISGIEPLHKERETDLKIDSENVKTPSPELGPQLLQQPENIIEQEKLSAEDQIIEEIVEENTNTDQFVEGEVGGSADGDENKNDIDKKESEENAAELLSGLLQTPSGTNIDLSNESPMVVLKECSIENKTTNIPLPEAPIDPSECQARLLEHIQKQQVIANTRLQSIEDQIIALESVDETSDKLENENYSRTKQTIQMLIRDLTTMRKIATVNSNEVYGTFI